MGKYHPDMFSFLHQIQKEQGETEICITEINMGRKTRSAPKKQYVQLQQRLQTIAEDYDVYKNDNDILKYLRTIAYNIVLQ